MTDIVNYLEEKLSGEKLNVKPRALLLLKLCQLSPLISEEVGDHYWKKLEPLSSYIPRKYKEQYKELKEIFHKPEESEAKGFAQVMISEINNASKEVKKSLEEAFSELEELEKRLRKRWWPFGKFPVWIALVKAWLRLDRKEALRLINKIPEQTLKNFLIQWNKALPFSEEEWGIAHKTCGSMRLQSILEEILLADFPKMNLPSKLAKNLGNKIKYNMLYSSEEMEYKKRIDELVKYKQLVGYLAQNNAKLAHSLMKDLFSEVASTDRFFGEKFPEAFLLVAQIINVWASLDRKNQEVKSYILKETPGFLRDFALAQWQAVTTETLDEAKTAYQELLDKASSKAKAEAWFLVTLIKNGLGKEALNLAESSKNIKDLKPRLRRAILITYPEKAGELFGTADFKEDPIDEFLMFSSNEERLNFLRDLTKKGSAHLPKELWSKPELTSLALAGDEKNKSLMHIYIKTTEKEKQFGVVLRLHGYGYYSHEEVDPYLLAVLAYWNEKNPEELRSMTTMMWNRMGPTDSDLQIELIRNHIFERCRTVLAAHPDTLARFINSVKKKLVDNSLQWGDYQTTYTLSLPETSPFLFALLAAEGIANLSPKFCDEILLNALKNYKGNEELITAAANMYASDKALEAVDPPTELNPPYLADAWQVAVVEATFQNIAKDLLEHYKVL